MQKMSSVFDTHKAKRC